MNLGIVELWAGEGDDAERNLGEALELARRNGRPYVEQGCLAHLAVAAGRRSLTALRELAGEALEILERFGWTSEPIVPLVLALMGSADAWQGRFDDAEPWIARAEEALRPNAEPAKALLVYWSAGHPAAGSGRPRRALAAFAGSRPDPFADWCRPIRWASRPAGTGCRRWCALGWATCPRLGAVLATAASDAERDHSRRRARRSAAIHLAERDTPGVDRGAAPGSPAPRTVVREVSVINALILDALARDMLGESRVAEDDVERALELAEPDALILPFLVTPARELLERHPRHRRRTRRCSAASSTCSRGRRSLLEAGTGRS